VDFLVPFGVLAVLCLILGDDDFEVDLGALGKYSRKRAAEKAAAKLGQSKIGERGEAFLETLVAGGAQDQADVDEGGG
jgi:hypothetical protein